MFLQEEGKGNFLLSEKFYGDSFRAWILGNVGLQIGFV